MELLKKHYEKILLGLVLVGLAVAVAFLPFKIASEKQKLEDLRQTLVHHRVDPLTNLDLTMAEKALKRIAMPALLDFSTTNRLFNPMPWQQTRDTPPKIIRADKTGPTAAVVTNITPLYLKLTLDSVNVGTESNAVKYVIGVEKQAAPNPRDRSKKQAYCKLREGNDTFTLVGVTGPADNPTNLVLELKDTGSNAIISKEIPFTRVDGYMTDLKYPPEGKNWEKRRVGATIPFNGEDYKIVAILQSEVILSAPNQKKWTIKSSASP